MEVKLLLITFLLLTLAHSKRLETVSESELAKLLKTEPYVLALFAPTKCPTCADLEHELASSREVLVDSIGAWVVRIDSAPLLRRYTVGVDPPAVLFFRSGSPPLLYHGPASEDSILSTVQSNLQPATRVLSDENFEHLTQASSGATTGDWFVLFHREDCSISTRLLPSWEAVGSLLKDRLNVATVDKDGGGGATARRFGVRGTPTIILLRHGNYYVYELEGYGVQELVNWATGFYRNGKAVAVPQPKSPFDDLVEAIVERLRSNPLILKAGSVVVGLLLLLGVGAKWKKGSRAVGDKKDK